MVSYRLANPHAGHKAAGPQLKTILTENDPKIRMFLPGSGLASRLLSMGSFLVVHGSHQFCFATTAIIDHSMYNCSFRAYG